MLKIATLTLEKTSLQVDASYNGSDATFEQLQGGEWKTIAFASRLLMGFVMI